MTSSSLESTFARTCDIDIALTSDLDRLGIDYLMRLELAIELARAFPTIDGIQIMILKRNTILVIVNMTSSESILSSDNAIIEDSFSSATSSSPTPSLDNWEVGKSLLRRIFADILEIEQNVITDDQDLNCLGLDSLTSMEAIYRIKKETYRHNIPNDKINERDVVNHEITIHALQTKLPLHQFLWFPRWVEV